MVLGALRQFQPGRILVTTLQALSGAGYPGVASLDALGNVIPYIGGGEEEKIETETLKLLGRYADGAVTNADYVVSAQVNRVPVPDGHTAVMSFELETQPSIEEVSAALAAFSAEPQARRLPTAPERPIILHAAQDRPQPRLDVAFGGGMPAHVGRVRRCPVLGYKLVAMGHNVVRGAAGAALLNAELMVARGLTVPAENARCLTTPGVEAEAEPSRRGRGRASRFTRLDVLVCTRMPAAAGLRRAVEAEIGHRGATLPISYSRRRRPSCARPSGTPPS